SAGSSLHAVFEGITPCSAQSRALPQIPKDSDCELMIWKIIFYQDAATGTPTTYLLESLYGASQPNSMGPAGGGTSIVMEGNWSVTKGAKTAPEADVYQLHAEDPQVVASFVKMSDDILHILNPDKTLMVGNAAWSYTLNRTDNRPPITMDVPVSSGPEVTRPPIPTMPPGAAVLAVYEGRSPCHEIVFEILKVAHYPNCLKVKSQLTLYQDQQTGVPTTYMYLGTSTIREGTWTTLEGTKDDPHADVYQLHLEGSKEPVFFLKADENHLFLLDRDLNLLVGNALFSYTLSKIEKDTK
ncbi:MAG TPA: hypothetical protein VFH34_01330, partial [Anaerolineales bacterium]|nr:hypothetical protein [Anaerolineales bacterium]